MAEKTQMAGTFAPLLPSATATYPLKIFLFGTFHVTLHAQPFTTFRSNKVRALLAYLVLAQSKPIGRTTLANLLWPDYTPNSARTNLRQVLSGLRELLSPFDLLRADYHTVQLLIDPDLIWCDALHFDELFDACQSHAHPVPAQCPLCQSRLQQAVDLYKGLFWENVGDLDSAPFQAWLQAQRTHYAGRFAEAQATLQSVAPAPPRGNLPQPLTSLVGRADELMALTTKLRHPIYRCLTLIGPGGIGKSRLAIALAEQMRTTFLDGVWFVPLAALPAENSDGSEKTHLLDRIATAISSALRLTLHGAGHPAQQLTDYLRDKTLLLILDNFEHLSDGVDLLVTLLQDAPNLRLVVTSRHRLSFQAQLVHQVAGLALPPEKAADLLPIDQVIERYASVQLFVERAENAQFPIERSALNLTTISALCRLVEGTPLAIELAVALLEKQTPSEILQAVRMNYAALQANLGDLPQRQRSAQAVLLTAWHLLAPQEAQTLARCSVFRGGFTLAAAQEIVGATAVDLDALVNKSLLHQIDGKRYTQHELVCQFTAEQLAVAETASQLVHDTHARYYLALLARWQPGTAAERLFRQVVQADRANVETAWDWALGRQQLPLLVNGIEGLAQFYDLVNDYYAAEAILQRSVAQVRTFLALLHPSATDQTALQTLLATLLIKLAEVYSVNLSQFQPARTLAEEGLNLAQTVANAQLLASGYYTLQSVAFGEMDYLRGQEFALAGVALAQQHGLQREQMRCLCGAGMNATGYHDHATALTYLEQAIALAQQTNDERQAQVCRNGLGVIYRNLGDFAQATACFEENLHLLRQEGSQFQIALATANLGILRLWLGDYTLAADYLRSGQQACMALGEKRIGTEILVILGQLYGQKGEYGNAINCGLEALTLAQTNDYQAALIFAWLTLGDVYLRTHAIDAAQNAYTQAAAASQHPDAATERLHAAMGLASVALAQNEKGTAMAAVNTLLTQFDPATADMFLAPQRFLFSAYQILMSAHDARAASVLQQAWQIVHSQAEKISDPVLRISFLTNVPVNREIRLLVAQMDNFSD